MQRNSISNTLTVSVVLCVACSVLVSGAAVGLRSRQDANKAFDQQKNILLACGLLTPEEVTRQSVIEQFETRIEKILIDLNTGKPASDPDEGLDLETFDARDAARTDELGMAIAPEDDFAKIKRRARYAVVYRVKGENGQTEGVVLPISGMGLWSVLYGYVALEDDLTTVKGITFYEHGETPGLGGEVDNPKWKASWTGKQIFGDDGSVQLKVVKGQASDSVDEVDGLSGATITSKGVSNLILYWLGQNGFGPYLDHQR